MLESKLIRLKEDLELEKPTMIVGLPGVGLVGKLVAEHLVDELKAEKVMEVYSPHFPPQVLVNADCTVRPVSNSIYLGRANERDIIFLVGDHQSTTSPGHYELCSLYLDLAEELKVSRIYTLGGYPTGKLTYEETILGVTNSTDLIGELKGYGVEFRESEPSGGIVGASGLLVAFSLMRGIDAACLMGMTPGYMMDPKSAQFLLKMLCSILGIEVNTESLEKKAEEMENIVEKLKEKEEQQKIQEIKPSEEDLRYIG
ncbi:proteasome assembly chaperone family protein [Methanosarcina sp. KYL-1]|uniref:proteasome assembly chaperone family protein n=1 Tax=Methanosarcina sp. KYL-1 TaxID=2602068 RepID=UPI0021013DBC|nr:proteasome assembly chaperone family protein [Methanosarcina sp. KYL-1]MCQ1536268.1 proteasome assembly chaperone family protein [Methanosarcina sp. KYL-1]